MINTLIPKKLWQLTFSLFGSEVYVFFHDGKKIVIDTSSKWNRLQLKSQLKELNLNPEDIDIVLLTHNHFDHIGNNSIFKNAKVYGHKEDFKSYEILDVNDLKLKGMKLIETPGHTEGGVCFYFTKDKILFSGDTLFTGGAVGRTDLQGGNSKKLKESLNKLNELDIEYLCPGHNL